MRAAVAFCTAALLWVGVACERGGSARDPKLAPDEVLQSELGLTSADVVHRVVLRGGEVERIEPPRVEVDPGDYVEFYSDDWRAHEVRFLKDSLGAEALEFLTRTDQVASPPLLEQGSRFLVSFEGAPGGRYPFGVEGNGRPGWGAVTVRPHTGR